MTVPNAGVRYFQAALDAKMADAGDDQAGFDAEIGAGVLDSLHDTVEMALEGEAGLGGMVGGRHDFDVDGTLGGAAPQVVVGHVAVVLGGLDECRGIIVDLQEMLEIVPGETALRIEQV